MKRVSVDHYELHNGAYICLCATIGNPKEKRWQRVSEDKVNAYRAKHDEFDRPGELQAIEDLLNEGRELYDPFPRMEAALQTILQEHKQETFISDMGSVLGLFSKRKTA